MCPKITIYLKCGQLLTSYRHTELSERMIRFAETMKFLTDLPTYIGNPDYQSAL